MKKIFFVLMIVHLSAYGQMLEKSKKWNDLHTQYYVKCKCTGGFQETHSYTLGKDTLIKSKIYHELYDSVFSPMDITVQMTGYISESNKNIYFIYKDDSQEVENLFYDFNLSLGDTFKIPNSSYKYIVTNIDSSEYFGIKHKTFHFSDSLFVWFEGLGSSKGFLYGVYPEPDALLCVSKNDSLIYKNGLGYDCVSTDIIDNINVFHQNNFFKIYPNPTSNKISIESDRIISRIELTDIYGKLIYRYFPQTSNYSLSLLSIDKGVYFIRINEQVKSVIKE